MSGHTGEVFARVDSPFNVFVTGFASGGPITNGEHFDEDWGLAASVPTAYEVTRSDIGGSSLSYATADFGFNAMRGPDYELGPFIRYNYYHAYMGTTGCIQLVRRHRTFARPLPGMFSPPGPGKANNERIGAFLQAAYRFNSLR